ncbi:acyl-CoA dehydrogenase family protein [soil metagenome]
MADLKNLKGISDADKKLIAEAEEWLGAEPTKMGPVKNLFWGRVKEDFYFPYPDQDARERADCDALLATLDQYLRTEHPSIQIDQEQEIPRWVIDRLFGFGVLGMTIPREFGGLGMGITSYNRVLERIGKSCGSTAVLVSAHQSIGCKAVMLFGNTEQKAKWLPHLARDWVSAFCLSEPNVGCDAGGQETNFTKTDDGEFYILNGEKKWATSGAISGLFTVMARQNKPAGSPPGKISALVCHPEMAGIEIYQRNRSKMSIRGTWQARIRFHNVRVPKSNLLGQEGRGLQIALSCLNYGRCTLSAGMLGGARAAMDQSITWSMTRFQFGKALAEQELVRKRIAHMAALCYATDAVLYMTTGMLDRKDDDIQVETAVCKVFCSEMGWRAVNDAVQIMGGEGNMSENEIERIFRDSRINLIVEGANEVMQSYIFGYGGKQLAEQMVGIKNALMREEGESMGAFLAKAVKNSLRPPIMKIAIPLGLEVFLGIRRKLPRITRIAPELREQADRVAAMARELTYQFKRMSKRYDVKLLERQAVQARLADAAILTHGWLCTLAKLDMDLKRRGTRTEAEMARDRAAALHFFDLAELEIRACFANCDENADDTMLPAADAAMAFTKTLPVDRFIIPEKSPTDLRGKGRTPRQDGIKQFGGIPTVGGQGGGGAGPHGMTNGQGGAAGNGYQPVGANAPAGSAPR